jgi:hypothetical protein
VGNLDRFQPASLGLAALTLLLALSVSGELVVGFLFCEIGCLTFIWAADVIRGYIGFGVTQETPGGCLVVAGWIGQIFLLLMAVAIVVLRSVRR